MAWEFDDLIITIGEIMALTILFMMLFSVILVIRDYKNKYTLLFILMIIGMSVSFFTIVMEIYKSSNYLVPSNFIYSSIEYKMFLILSKIIKLPLSSLLILRNLGIFTYLLAIMFFVFSFNKSIKSSTPNVKHVKHIIKYISLIAYPILYFCFYHPDSAYRIYLFKYYLNNKHEQALWINFITTVDFIMVSIAFIYLLYPIGFLIENYLKNQITFFSEQLLGLAICLGLLNTIFFFVFFTGIFKTSISSVFRTAFWRCKLISVVPRFYATLMPVMTLFILLIILYILIRYKTNNMVVGFKERAVMKNLNLLNSNLKDVLHSDKNIMFNIKILAAEAVNYYGTKKGLDTLNKILELSDGHMNAISKALDNIRELRVKTLNYNFIEAIEAAIKEVAVPENISLTRHYNHHTPVHCNFDMYHMTQVISNLLTNSIDAINSLEHTQANIDLTVDVSSDWIYFSIKDTGCGIPKKMLKKIFNPYFSTKSKQNNWGIGLSYVYKVIKSHFGHIRIKSKPSEFTMVEILLPREP
ncbi:MAG: HAMP domain-containing sensor histidine kinase [Anaerocolumna sp.]